MVECFSQELSWISVRLNVIFVQERCTLRKRTPNGLAAKLDDQEYVVFELDEVFQLRQKNITHITHLYHKKESLEKLRLNTNSIMTKTRIPTLEHRYIPSVAAHPYRQWEDVCRRDSALARAVEKVLRRLLHGGDQGWNPLVWMLVEIPSLSIS